MSEIGEFEEDGALDERDTLIQGLVERIEKSITFAYFCGVDISGVRANIAMLATIIGHHGGGHLIELATVAEWARKIDEPFTDESKWGFTPWRDEVKSEWRAGCKQTVQNLLEVLDD
jgi:hypothetical protein